MSDFRARLETVSQGPEYYISQQSLRAKDDLIEDLQGQIAKLNQELKIIKLDKVLQRDEIYALKAEARSYQEELGKSKLKAQDLETKSLQETLANDMGKKSGSDTLSAIAKRWGNQSAKLAMTISSPEIAQLTAGDRLWILGCIRPDRCPTRTSTKTYIGLLQEKCGNGEIFLR